MNQQLIDKFDIPNVLATEQTEHGLSRLSVTSAACSAELYLQGAHLTQWKPAGHQSVLFLSKRSHFLPGKAIRGGVPIIFPWFGPRTETKYSPRTDGPSHGFARTSEWQLAAAEVVGDDVHLTLKLDPSAVSRALGYDNFQLTYKVVLGAQLDLQLTVENQSPTPMVIEEAFHSYFSVGDVRQINLDGLADSDYLDKTDGLKRKHQDEQALVLTGETDRPYLNTTTNIDLIDPVFKRRITVQKTNSKTTVIWNPWSQIASNLSDMSADGWLRMICIETANALDDAITVKGGEKHTMRASISVQAT